MDEVIEAIEKYQGLVPLVYDIETVVLDEARPQDMPYAVYLKREADKVIAHQKYKRCLAMALLWLDRSENSTDLENELVSRRRYGIWLELAKKFKEAK